MWLELGSLGTITTKLLRRERFAANIAKLPNLFQKP
jgi:hypothetical protein